MGGQGAEALPKPCEIAGLGPCEQPHPRLPVAGLFLGFNGHLDTLVHLSNLLYN